MEGGMSRDEMTIKMLLATISAINAIAGAYETGTTKAALRLVKELGPVCVKIRDKFKKMFDNTPGAGTG